MVRAQDEILALALASCVALGRLSGPLCRSFPICNVAVTVVPTLWGYCEDEMVQPM